MSFSIRRMRSLLFIILLLSAAACQTYQAKGVYYDKMSASQAREDIETIVKKRTILGDGAIFTYSEEGLKIHAVNSYNGTPYDYFFKYTDKRSTYLEDFGMWTYGVKDNNDNTLILSHDDGVKFTEDVAALEYLIRREKQNAESTLENFQAVADQYHSSKDHEFPEDAHRYRAVAEQAFKDKNYQSAIDNYKTALEIAPWWPEGHYNRGLLLGQQGLYSAAVIELKKYLMLVPSAPNARNAKDKIYIWESKAK